MPARELVMRRRAHLSAGSHSGRVDCVYIEDAAGCFKTIRLRAMQTGIQGIPVVASRKLPQRRALPSGSSHLAANIRLLREALVGKTHRTDRPLAHQIHSILLSGYRGLCARSTQRSAHVVTADS